MILDNIAQIEILRKPVIKILSLTSFDMRITNPWSGQKVCLNSFKHKGYWFYGRRREQKTMALFKRYANEGSRIIEIGGHIGWITQYFSKLAGNRGAVEVFEPGLNNYSYIAKNTASCPNVVIIRKAV